ncbi:hypothetical protein CCACVL1_09377 [Corchorus capsularis]|uniref:HAT C-terminal dimerisation domain-containing protein n=1 Tax=Corchorus capsularis TaxID=210143 RepID=A0A1R3IWG6_COCAP|nr:hypothetical protein CCACVL1_09377 [Corchorus capsularis]
MLMDANEENENVVNVEVEKDNAREKRAAEEGIKMEQPHSTRYIWKLASNMVVTLGKPLFLLHLSLDPQLQKRFLNFVDVPPPNTRLVVSDALWKCLQEWGIKGKVCTITVDNASYNDVAVRNLQDSLSFQRKLPLDGKLFHVRCCAHILNLLVQNGISEIQGIIANVWESVKYISASTQHLNTFNDIAKQLQLPNKKLILDCCTWWNATCSMLSCALEFKQVFSRFAQRDSNYKFLPSDDDWLRVEEVCSFLTLFNEVTNIISGFEYPTSNLFLPELWVIKELIEEKCFSQVPWIEAMAEKMALKFDKYWGDCNLLISIAVVLDLRNKMVLINIAYQAARQTGILLENLENLYKEYLDAYTTATDVELRQNDVSQTDGGSSAGLVVSGRNALTGRSKFERFIQSQNGFADDVKSELETYLEEGVYWCKENSNEFDALEWWKENNLKFRILSKMACEIMSILLTTVASESTFSVGSRVIDTYRSSLGTDIVQMLLCGSDWLRNFYGMKRKKKGQEEVKEILLG